MFVLILLPAMSTTMESSNSMTRPGSHQSVPHHNANHPMHNRNRNFKLLADPFLTKGGAKIYRFDGVPIDGTQPLVICRDPRSTLTRIWTRLEQLDLPIPRFKVSIAALCGKHVFEKLSSFTEDTSSLLYFCHFIL